MKCYCLSCLFVFEMGVNLLSAFYLSWPHVFPSPLHQYQRTPASDYQGSFLESQPRKSNRRSQIHDFTSQSFDIMKYVSFTKSGTRMRTHKLIHVRPASSSHGQTSEAVECAILDLSLSIDTLTSKVKEFLSIFTANFISSNTCMFYLIPCNRCSSIPMHCSTDARMH